MSSLYPPIPIHSGSLRLIILSRLLHQVDQSTGSSSDSYKSIISFLDQLSPPPLCSGITLPHSPALSALPHPPSSTHHSTHAAHHLAPLGGSLTKQLFPGLIYRMMKPKVVLLIFVSGKIVLTGAKVREEIYMAFNQIYSVLVGTSFFLFPPFLLYLLLLLPLTYPHTLPCPSPLLHSVAFGLLSIPTLNLH